MKHCSRIVKLCSCISGQPWPPHHPPLHIKPSCSIQLAGAYFIAPRERKAKQSNRLDPTAQAVHGHISTKVTDLKATICAHHSSAAASLVGPDSCNAPSRRDGGGVHPPALATAARAINAVKIIGDVLDAAILPNHTRSGRAAKRSTARPHDLHRVPVINSLEKTLLRSYTVQCCSLCRMPSTSRLRFSFFCVGDTAPVAYMYTMQVQA
jgi:hypothetical protein